MAPKKGQKMSLNAFLGDSALGSWADEMDALPSAPAMRTDDDLSRSNERYQRRGDDFLSSRPDRGLAHREDLPLPTRPPFTAFVGNLAFDLTEQDLADFFASPKTKSVKIIKDREEKPKGFGYMEFEDLDGLKDALTKNGSNLAGRSIRVSVAEPPKERPGFGTTSDDDSKFDSPWRRAGPLPDLPDSRDGPRRRYDVQGSDRGERSQFGASDTASEWRSNKPRAEADPSLTRRQGSSFSMQEGQRGSADNDDAWVLGSKFRPSSDDSHSHNKFGSLKGRGDMGPPPPPSDEGDWRSTARVRPARNTSPISSTPVTPQLARKKLELLPRSNSSSAAPSPLSSPKLPPTRENPFGKATPIVVRDPIPKSTAGTTTPPTSTVRPSVSFASAAWAKGSGRESQSEGKADIAADSTT